MVPFWGASYGCNSMTMLSVFLVVMGCLHVEQGVRNFVQKCHSCDGVLDQCRCGAGTVTASRQM